MVTQSPLPSILISGQLSSETPGSAGAPIVANTVTEVTANTAATLLNSRKTFCHNLLSHKVVARKWVARNAFART